MQTAFLFFLTIAAVGTWLLVNTGNQSSIPVFYIILAQLSLGIFVFSRDIKKDVNQSFFLFTASLAWWNATAVMLTTARTGIKMMVWDKIIFVPAALMVAFLLDFTFLFPRRSNRYSTVIRFLVFWAAFLLILAIPFNLIIKGIAVINGVVSPVFGLAYPLFVVYAILFAGGSLVNLVYKYLRSRGTEKIQLRYVLLGLLLISVGITLTNLLLPWFSLAQFAEFGPAFSLFPLAFTAYAITKHRLLDISIVISRAVAEVLTVVVLGAGYLGFVWFYVNFVSSVIGFTFVTFTVVFGVFVGQVHQRLRLFIQTTSDKLFLRGKYDYYRELSAATLKVGEKLSLEAILKILYRTFSEVVEISIPRIYLPEHFTDPEKQSKNYVIYDEEGDKQAADEIRADSALVERLLVERSPQLDLHNPTQALVVPCLLEDRLIAFFVLGRKLSEDHYTDEDIHLLEVLGSQAAMALDHTRSYEKIRADLEVAERQLARSQRLASLGTLTAGVTHEIRNPLTVIRSETERLANKERDQDYLKKFSGLLLKHIDRISGIVQRMLSMAKEKETKEAEVDLQELINASLSLVDLKQVQVTKDYELVPMIKGDPVALEEVFVNLIQNAVQAMAGQGQITLRTYIDDGRAIVEITDTGKGIPEGIKEKIFDPFFSTRHEGVGLGLSIAYRIIREHGGDIQIDSEVGRGTTFRLSF